MTAPRRPRAQEIRRRSFQLRERPWTVLANATKRSSGCCGNRSETPQRGGVTDACLDAETLAAWTDGGLSGARSSRRSCTWRTAPAARAGRNAGAHQLDRAAGRAGPAVAPLARLVRAAHGRGGRRGAVVRGSRQSWRASDVASRARRCCGSAGVADRPRRDRRRPPRLHRRKRRRRTPGAGRPRRRRVPQAAELAEEAARSNDAAISRLPPETWRKQEAAGRNLAKDRGRSVQRRPHLRQRPPAPRRRRLPSNRRAERSARSGPARRRRRRAGDRVARPPVRWRIAGGGRAAFHQRRLDVGNVSRRRRRRTDRGRRAGADRLLAGRPRGVVLLTTDGRTLRRVPFPEMTDLSAVRTVDAGGRVASVSTADGRTFVTTDAGATWSPASPRRSARLRPAGDVRPDGGTLRLQEFPAAPF